MVPLVFVEDEEILFSHFHFLFSPFVGGKLERALPFFKHHRPSGAGMLYALNAIEEVNISAYTNRVRGKGK
jgi:hypothetical protein